MHPAIILASAGALKNATDEAIVEILRFALHNNTVELSLVALKSDAFKINDKKLFSDLLDLAMREESTQLALAVCHTATQPHEGTSFLSQDEVFDLVLSKYPVTDFVTRLFQAGASDAVGPQTAKNILFFALAKKSVELTLTVCKASTLTRETVPSEMIAQVVELIRNTNALEMACKGDATSADKQKIVGDILLLGEKFESVELVLAVASLTAALHVLRLTNVVLARLLQFALRHRSVELTIVLCKAGALDGVAAWTVNDVLAFALESKSLELALLTFQPDVLITFQADDVLAFDERTADLMQATACLALDTSSVELSILVCQRDEFDPTNAKVASQMLRLGMDSDSVELVLAVLSNAEACASTPSEMLVALLQLAVKQTSSQLATLVCNAGAVTSADDQLLSAALEMAIDQLSNELLVLLIDAGVLQRSDDKVKSKVLFHAAAIGDLQLADHCVSCGVLNRADRWDKPTPIDIATQRGHSRLALRLSKALDNHKLLSLGQRKANTVLIRVAGPPGAGKSTLVKSLTTSRLRGFFRWESQTDEGDRNFQTRTRGIQVDSFEWNTVSHSGPWRPGGLCFCQSAVYRRRADPCHQHHHRFIAKAFTGNGGGSAEVVSIFRQSQGQPVCCARSCSPTSHRRCNTF